MMSYGRVLATTVLALLAAPAASAQLSSELQSRVDALMAKPLVRWTAADLEESVAITVSQAREMLLRTMSTDERAAAAKAAVRVVDDDRVPAASTDGKVIQVSGPAIAELTGIGLYLGHDIYVLRGDSMPMTPHLLYHPYTASALLPLVPTLASANLDLAKQHLVRCPPIKPACAQPQEVAVLATIMFLVAHELAHEVLGHPHLRERPLDHELSADRKAWSFFQPLLPDAVENERTLDARFRTAIVTAPFLVLRWLHENASSNSERDKIAQRIGAMQDIIGDEYYTDVQTLAERGAPDRQLQEVAVTWSNRPDELYIDGLRVDAAEIEKSTVWLLDGTRVFARYGACFASARVPNATGHERITVSLVFLQPATGPVDLDEIERLRRQRRWFEIVLESTTGTMRPRSLAAALKLAEALDSLGLAHLADAAAFGDGRPRDILTRSVKRYEPLANWRPKGRR